MPHLSGSPSDFAQEMIPLEEGKNPLLLGGKKTFANQKVPKKDPDPNAPWDWHIYLHEWHQLGLVTAMLFLLPPALRGGCGHHCSQPGQSHGAQVRSTPSAKVVTVNHSECPLWNSVIS